MTAEDLEAVYLKVVESGTDATHTTHCARHWTELGSAYRIGRGVLLVCRDTADGTAPAWGDLAELRRSTGERFKLPAGLQLRYFMLPRDAGQPAGGWCPTCERRLEFSTTDVISSMRTSSTLEVR